MQLPASLAPMPDAAFVGVNSASASHRLQQDKLALGALAGVRATIDEAPGLFRS